MPEPDEIVRLFVAVELPEDVRAVLTATTDALQRAGAGDAVRWVRPEGVHLTLKFLGATPAEQLPAVTSALDATVPAVHHFELETSGAGSFGGPRNLRVIWVGIGGDTAALAKLAASVESALAPLGFPTEQRPFAAHLTLGRVREGTPTTERERIARSLGAVPMPPGPPFRVDRVSLMQSTLGRGGAVYRTVATFPLQ